jgi:hypothetical protein
MDYKHKPTPVFLVNPDGSARRRDDTDDEGIKQRRLPDHAWACWFDEHGPGYKMGQRVERMHTRLGRALTGVAVLVFLLGTIATPLICAWIARR